MKTVFITGATSGIGKAIARRFIENQCRVVVTGRRFERLQELVDMCPERVLALQLDVRDQQGVFNAIRNLPDEFAEIDVLVNNAGLLLGTKNAQECDIEDWKVVVDTNINGLMYCTLAVLPGMVARNRGHIVNIGSIGATHAYRGACIYGASKAFVSQFGRMLRSDLFGTRVRVTTIEAGVVETEFTLVRTRGNDALSRAQYANCHAMMPEDIAECVYWATSMPEFVDVTRLEVWPITQNMTELQILREQEDGRLQLGSLSIHVDG